MCASGPGCVGAPPIGCAGTALPTLAADCSGRCANDCSGRGVCAQGEVCVCSRRFVDADCSVPVADLLSRESLAEWGVLDDLASRGDGEVGQKSKRAKLDPSHELHMNTKSTRQYVADLCTREKCNS